MSTEVESLIQRLEDMGVVVVAWSWMDVVQAHEAQYGYPCTTGHADEILESASSAIVERCMEAGHLELGLFVTKEETEED